MIIRLFQVNLPHRSSKESTPCSGSGIGLETVCLSPDVFVEILGEMSLDQQQVGSRARMLAFDGGGIKEMNFLCECGARHAGEVVQLEHFDDE